MIEKNVLFISPTISDIYKDIITQLNKWGMHVDFIEDYGDHNDPDFIRVTRSKFTDNKYGRSQYNKRNLRKWQELLSKSPYDKRYDYLLVIDGMSIHTFLFEELRKRNPNLWATNYLFDSCTSLYRFERKFKYFNRVASFDKADCKRFNLSFLPIYWVLPDKNLKKKYDIFAFGGFGRERFNVFKYIDEVSNQLGLRSYIKLYTPTARNYKSFAIKSKLKHLFGYNKRSITTSEYNSNLITHQGIPASEFQKIIFQSDCIVDTLNYEQDGMTARFMWALGAKKKIITNNVHFKGYDCYDPNQVYILEKGSFDNHLADLEKFIRRKYECDEAKFRSILPWRIDNWLMYLLNIQHLLR